MGKKEDSLCIPEPTLPDEGIDEAVEQMSLEEVVAYVRLHKIDFDEPSTWLDDKWPEKESWLRSVVIEHMEARIHKPSK